MGLLAILAASPAGAVVPAIDAPGIARAIEVQEFHTEGLLAAEGVVGTAVGAGSDGKPVIKIFTETAEVSGLPKKLDGVPVEVEVTGKIVALKRPPAAAEAVDTTARFDRPVPIGVSTGHPNITAGTIGSRVKNGTKVYALSNNHVYADENRANISDNVLQPGPFDGGENPTDAIGTLFDFGPITFCNPYPSNCPNNTIDAAIALSDTTLLGNATPSDGYGKPKSSTVPPTFNLPVMKYGRTTGLTKGKITGINATVNVGYDSGVARFTGQIIIQPGNFSAGGDSGSLIVVQKGTNARKPVGLLFAGSPSITIANPIGAVLGEFGVTIDGE